MYWDSVLSTVFKDGDSPEHCFHGLVLSLEYCLHGLGICLEHSLHGLKLSLEHCFDGLGRWTDFA